MTKDSYRRIPTLLSWCSVAMLAAGCGGGSGGGGPPDSTLYSVSATVQGLSGSGLVLQNNQTGSIPVSANGSVTILTGAQAGTAYSVTVFAQPSGQTCNVTNGLGTVGTSNVTNIQVACAATPSSFSVGGFVSGLTTGSVALLNNGGDLLLVNASGPFTFATSLGNGLAYAVTISSQPAGLQCNVANASGNIASASVANVQVVCAPAGSTGLGGIIGVGAGGASSTAVDGAGALWTWGSNQLNGLAVNITSRDRAATVPGLSGVTQVAAGFSHQLALRNDGTVWAWGDNNQGQLGDGTRDDRVTPVQVTGLTNVQAIAVGFVHSLALRTDGTVWAWGENDQGQLGDGTQATDRLVPVQVGTLTGVVSISAGLIHSLAVRNDGSLWGWGNGLYIGLAVPPVYYLTPTQQPDLQNVISVRACPNHSMALRSDGTVWTWGSNDQGQLGNGLVVSSFIPAQVPGLTGVVKLAQCPHQTSAVIRSDGGLWAWGGNANGQLGDGTNTVRRSPVAVLLPGPVSEAAAGLAHSLAVLADGSVYSWGSNTGGSLGTGSPDSSFLPVRVVTE